MIGKVAQRLVIGVILIAMVAEVEKAFMAELMIKTCRLYLR